MSEALPVKNRRKPEGSKQNEKASAADECPLARRRLGSGGRQDKGSGAMPDMKKEEMKKDAMPAPMKMEETKGSAPMADPMKKDDMKGSGTMAEPMKKDEMKGSGSMPEKK